MNTRLPIKIETIEGAKQFLTELNNNDEIYHPEDDAHDVDWTNTIEPTNEEKDQLNKLMDDIYNLPEVWSPTNPKGWDPCCYVLTLI